MGIFGLSQTGEMFERTNTTIMRKKVMNTTFYDTRFIYRGERGIQDDEEKGLWEAREKVGGGFHFVGRSVRARVSWELSSARRARWTVFSSTKRGRR